MKKKQDLHNELRLVFDGLKKFRENHPDVWKLINKGLTENASTTLTDADAALFYALEIIDDTDFE